MDEETKAAIEKLTQAVEEMRLTIERAHNPPFDFTQPLQPTEPAWTPPVDTVTVEYPGTGDPPLSPYVFPTTSPPFRWGPNS